MKMVLVGQRGVGKSSLLQRLQIYTQTLGPEVAGKNVAIFDLDREIEKAVGAKIKDIFELIGEKNFRELERATFRGLAFHPRFIIAVGAGFELDYGPFEEDVQVVWVRRRSDELGRIFLDRPRLDPDVLPLQEFHQRAAVRAKLYAKVCHWIYEMPEGTNSPTEEERALFFDEAGDWGGIYTLRSADFKNIELLKQRIAYAGFDLIEARNDLISVHEYQLLLTMVPKEKLLTSFRSSAALTEMQKLSVHSGHVDWGLELGYAMTSATIVSVHGRAADEPLPQAIERLETAGRDKHLKLAVPIHNFTELQQGLNWQQADPEHRSFLPRSDNGRWRWVRQWLKGRQLLNFISSGFDEVGDQPSLMDWLRTPEHVPQLPTYFAAVLGQPVDHSYSPTEQYTFFKTKQAAFFAIGIAVDEWSIAMPLLQRMGLRWAAVTSPLKESAFQWAHANCTAEARDMTAVNTLVFADHKWQGHNTDVHGFRELCSSMDLDATTMEPIAIWGGGGTLNTVRAVLPQAIPYSVRERGPRPGFGAVRPNFLIWAASPTAELPPDDWRPSAVIDLNYRDDSRGKEYSQMVEARYVSGLMMFYAQAKAQRQYWEKFYVRE